MKKRICFGGSKRRVLPIFLQLFILQKIAKGPIERREARLQPNEDLEVFAEWNYPKKKRR